MSTEYKSNLKRCPLIKVTKKEYKRDCRGDIIEEITAEEFNDCYKSFCMAWDSKNNKCTYFDFSIESTDEETEEEG